MSMDEEWRAAFGWEGFYEVSNLGRVRSRPRVWESGIGPRVYGGRDVVAFMGTRKYPVVNLTMPGLRRQVFVHKLVLESFCGPRPEGMEACHNNGDRKDCRLENLRWDTRSNNHKDKRKHGTWQVGERANNARLTTEIVQAIRKSGMSAAAVSRCFYVSKSQAKRILNGTAWGHLI